MSARRLMVIGAHSADFVWRAGGACAVTTTNGGTARVIALSYGERGESGELWKEEGQTIENVKKVRHGGLLVPAGLNANNRDAGAVIRVGSSEHNAGARSRPAILADVCEAVIGAVYLDGGYKAAEEVVERLWQVRQASMRCRLLP